MAKNSFPMPKSSSGLASKFVGLLILITVVTLIVKYPADSAGWISGAANGVGKLVDGLVAFFRALFG